LAETTWTWVSAAQAGKTVTPKKADAFTITFGGDGTLSGKTDCNSFSGPYEADNGALHFTGPIASTLMFCEGSQEPEYVTIMQDVAGYEITGDQLVLRLKTEGTMTFKK
jgi:heat shock protein HslJ